MSTRAGSAPGQIKGFMVVVPVLAAALGATTAAIAITVVPASRLALAVVGVAAVALISAAPVRSVFVLALLRATLEGTSSETLLRVLGIQLSPVDVVTLAFLGGSVVWLLRKVIARQIDWRIPTLRPTGVFLGVAFLSLTYSPAWQLGARDLTKFAAAYCAFLVIAFARLDRVRLRKLLTFVVYGAIPPIAFAWWQFAHTAAGVSGFGALRVQSTFEHPNTFGFYLVAIAAASWGVFHDARPGIERRIGGAVGLAAFVTLFTTLSRNSLAALGLLIVVLGWRRARVLVGAAAVATGIVLALPRVTARALEFFQDTPGRNSGNSFIARLALWGKDLSFWHDSPVLGNGWGATLASLDSLSHNDFLRALVEAGVIGFASFVALMGSLVRHSYRAARGRSDFPRAFLGLSVGYLLVSVSSNNLGKGAFQFYFWLLAAICYLWADAHAANGVAHAPTTPRRAIAHNT